MFIQKFLDELITWRELSYHSAELLPDYETYGSLPGWALASLDAHRDDEREYIYSLEQFAAAETHDELWNAAQRQLTRDGIIHNYLRMLWGKKILEWTASPEDAHAVMVELNNRYALMAATRQAIPELCGHWVVMIVPGKNVRYSA